MRTRNTYSHICNWVGTRVAIVVGKKSFCLTLIQPNWGGGNDRLFSVQALLPIFVVARSENQWSFLLCLDPGKVDAAYLVYFFVHDRMTRTGRLAGTVFPSFQNIAWNNYGSNITRCENNQLKIVLTLSGADANVFSCVCKIACFAARILLIRANQRVVMHAIIVRTYVRTDIKQRTFSSLPPCSFSFSLFLNCSSLGKH